MLTGPAWRKHHRVTTTQPTGKPTMAAIEALVDSADTLWTAVAALAVLVVGFVIGRRLVRKV